MDSSTPAERNVVLRIIDANFDRASEGLRVVEEFARFGLEDRFLTGRVKNLRHRLHAAMQKIPHSELLAARETQQDVGTSVTTPAEYVRSDVRDVVRANFQRVQQALRAIEEYGKAIASDVAVEVEAIRYGVYTLEKAVIRTDDARERLAGATIYVLLDGCGSLEAFTHRAEQLIAAGIDIIQLREKNGDDRSRLQLARRLREITRDSSTLFIVNDRPDIAALSHADGVHVGQEELSVQEARSIVGPQKLIGVSTHSIEQARQAVLDGADYLGCGPTFPSTTKSFASFPGLPFLREVAAEISLPAFAIGGINASNVHDVRLAGFRRIALSGGLSPSENLSHQLQNLRQSLNTPN